MLSSNVKTGGRVKHRVIRTPQNTNTVWQIFKSTLPTNTWKLKNWPNIMRGLHKIILAKILQIPTHYGILTVRLIKADGNVYNYGIVSTRMITDAGVNFIVDAFQDTAELETLKFHGIGTGSIAEAKSNTGLGGELATAVYTANARATGSQGEDAANIYRTTATNTVTVVNGTVGITEHGIFSNATRGTGILLDRSIFSVINLSSGDSLETQYNLTISSGG